MHDRASRLLHLWAACSLHGAAADSITISISVRMHIELKVLFCSTSTIQFFLLEGPAAHITSMIKVVTFFTASVWHDELATPVCLHLD